ncbi:MAG: hypothetical protein IPM71_16350 [Bacteroidota bacterium]|nr:MAG: hypothetical protein IPM71_16350 [Bacteroidota bacterium]
MNAIKIINCTDKSIPFNAREYLNFIRKSNDFWWNENYEKCEWIFRGQWNSNWNLKPSAWREPNTTLDPLIKKIDDSQDYQDQDINEFEKKFMLQTQAEIKAVADFTNLARILGFKIPEKNFHTPLKASPN